VSETLFPNNKSLWLWVPAFAKEHADRAGLRAQAKGIATAKLFRPRR